MVIKLKEIYEARSGNTSVGSNAPFRKRFDSRDVYVNPGHVVCLREEETFRRILSESDHAKTIDTKMSFTRVFLDRGQSGIDLVVEGTPSEIEQRLGQTGVLYG
jgi:hypothetical protein